MIENPEHESEYVGFPGHVPTNIGVYVNLKKLTLSNCELRMLPDGLENLRQLKSLDIQANNLSSLDKIFNLSWLVYLNASYCGTFEEFPSGFRNMKKLKDLEFEWNGLITIPEEILPHMESLKFLNLSNNQLSILPNDLAQLELNIINLKENNFRWFPNVLQTMSVPFVEGLSIYHELNSNLNDVFLRQSTISDDIETFLIVNLHGAYMKSVSNEQLDLIIPPMDVSLIEAVPIGVCNYVLEGMMHNILSTIGESSKPSFSVDSVHEEALLCSIRKSIGFSHNNMNNMCNAHPSIMNDTRTKYRSHSNNRRLHYHYVEGMKNFPNKTYIYEKNIDHPNYKHCMILIQRHKTTGYMRYIDLIDVLRPQTNQMINSYMLLHYLKNAYDINYIQIIDLACSVVYDPVKNNMLDNTEIETSMMASRSPFIRKGGKKKRNTRRVKGKTKQRKIKTHKRQNKNLKVRKYKKNNMQLT